MCAFCLIKIPYYNSLRPIMPVKGRSLLADSREDIRYLQGSPVDNIFREPVEYLSRVADDNTSIGLIFRRKLWFYQFFNNGLSNY